MADIVLKNVNGETQTYSGVNVVKLADSNGNYNDYLPRGSNADWNAVILEYQRTDITPLVTDEEWLVLDNAEIEAYYPMTVGDTVYVTVNGIEYEKSLERQLFFGVELYLYAGNLALDPNYSGEGNSDPFLFYVSPSRGIFGVYVESESTVKIEWNKPIIESSLPAIFLPYEYASTLYVDAENQKLEEKIEDVVFNVDAKNAFQDAEIAQLADLISDLQEEPPKATSLDLSTYDSGTITETLSDGSKVTYTVTFDENGNPTNINNGTDDFAIVWGDMPSILEEIENGYY